MNFIRSAFRASRPSLSRVQSLFLPDDKAALFDYSNTSNLYQNSDATGAAAVGSPVGALLDVSRGLELGPELAPQGGLFTASTGWNTGAGTVISGGVATTTSVAAGTTTVTTTNGVGTIGKMYEIVCVVDSISGGTLRPVLFGNTLSSNLISAPGTYTFRVVASADVARFQAFTTTSAVMSRFSIRELKGNHAIWPTTAQKPTLRQTDLTKRYWLEAIDANRALNITFATAPGTMCVGRVTPEGMKWRTEVWGTSVNILEVDALNSGLIARSRPFVAAERALAEAYFARQSTSEYTTTPYRVVKNMLTASNVSATAVDRAESWSGATGFSQFTENGSAINLLESDTVSEFVAPVGARVFKTATVSVLAGRTYAVSCDVVAIELNGAANVSLFAATAIGGSQPSCLATSTGRHVAFFTVTADNPSAGVRFGVQATSSIAQRSVSLKSPMIQDVTDFAPGILDGYISRMAAKRYAPGGTVVSLKLAPADGPKLGEIMSRYRHVLAVGDSFANDGKEWPTQFHIVTGVATTGKGWPGGTLATTICANAEAEIDANPGLYSTIVIQGGVNDASGLANPETTRAAVASLVSKCRAQRMRIFMCNVAPWSGSAGSTEAKQAATAAHNAWLASGGAGADVVVVDIYSALSDPANPTRLLPAYDSGDGLHPSTVGSQVIAETIAGAL